jgi:hypothetical protein
MNPPMMGPMIGPKKGIADQIIIGLQVSYANCKLSKV